MDTQPDKTIKRNVLIVILLLLLVLGIGAYLIFSQKQRGEQNNENQLPQSVLPKPSDDQDINQPSQSKDEVKVYFVDLENKRKVAPTIGCGDSLAPITRTLNKSGKNIEEIIKITLGYLFEPKEQYIGKGGLYNSLYQSSLTVDKVTLDKGVSSIYLKGSYLLGGECDDPRFEGQIKQTVLQFSEVKSVLIFINGTQLNLSLK
jgi:hypothetical protein